MFTRSAQTYHVITLILIPVSIAMLFTHRNTALTDQHPGENHLTSKNTQKENDLGIAHLTRDYPSDLQSLSFDGVEFQGAFYFLTNTFNFFELWRTDGSPEGSILIKTAPGQANLLTPVGDKLFFSVSDRDLWVSDGSTSGTYFLISFAVGEYLREFVDVDGTLFFAASDGTRGKELWKSDGTSAGTNLVKDIRVGGNSYPQVLTNMNGTLFFVANDGINGKQLWKSDGTVTGTVQVVEDVSYPSGLTVVGEVLFFFSNGLWKTDGTPGGTIFISPTSGSVSYEWRKPTVVDGIFYFSKGTELWKSDGTTPGTQMVIELPEDDGYYDIRYLTNFHGLLLFNFGGNVWKSDGSLAGTQSIANAGEDGFIVTSSWFYFLGYDPNHGEEIWKSNGTTSGSEIVIDLNPGPDKSNIQQLYKAGDNVIFSRWDETVSNSVWVTDGTSSGTTNIFTQQYESSGGGSQHIGLGEWLYYMGDTDETGRELWKSDGSELGTDIVRDIMPSGGNSNPHYLTDWHGSLYFAAEGRNLGSELWKSDGTASGTAMITDITPGAGSSWPERLTPGLDTFYFTTATLNGLWKTDGTSEGTSLIKQFAGFGNVNDPLVEINGELFFAAQDGQDNPELWKSDGSSAGTVAIKDIWPNGWREPRFLTAVNGKLFFSADDGVHGQELWKSNGTSAGTVIVKDIFPNENGSFPYWLYNLNSQLFFIADDGEHGIELWTSDGTSPGTHMVMDIYPGEASSFYTLGDVPIYKNYSPNPFMIFNNELYFIARDDIHGFELWKSDGTPQGTQMVKDINPFSSSMHPPFYSHLGTTMLVLNDRLFFIADDSEHGFEIWSTDGSENGTYLEQEIMPGAATAFPILLAVKEPNIYFTADDRIHGRELWALPYATDLRVTKSSDPVPARSILPLTYHILVSNSGLPSSSITLTDELPVGFTEIAQVSNPTGCSIIQNLLTCDIGNLDSGKNHEIIVQGFPIITGEIENTAHVTLAETDVNLANNSNTDVNTIFPPDLAFTSVLNNWCGGNYFDDFSDPDSGWPDNGYVDYDFGYSSGEYRIYVLRADMEVVIAPGINSESFAVDFDVRNETGAYSSYGLVFGLPESSNCCEKYSFEITPDQGFGLFRFNPQNWNWDILASGSSSWINPGTESNHIRVERFGTRIKVYINHQALIELDDATYTGIRSVGWIVTTYATPNVDIRFDNINMCGALNQFEPAISRLSSPTPFLDVISNRIDHSHKESLSEER